MTLAELMGQVDLVLCFFDLLNELHSGHDGFIPPEKRIVTLGKGHFPEFGGDEVTAVILGGDDVLHAYVIAMEPGIQTAYILIGQVKGQKDFFALG